MTTQADKIVAAGEHKLGLPFKLGAGKTKGPIDCVHLVDLCSGEIGRKDLVANAYGRYIVTVTGLVNLWKRKHRNITYHLSEAKKGDFIVFGNNEHIGIAYVDGGSFCLSARYPKVSIDLTNNIGTTTKHAPSFKMVLQTGLWANEVD